MPETRYTFCRICETLCGFETEIENDQIVNLKPDTGHVSTKGYSCIKGRRQYEIYNSPDRLLYPLKKVNGKHERISWEQAIREIGQKVNTITKENSRDSIAMYIGTAAGFGVLHPAFAQGFMDGIGSNNMYASATQDCSNKFAVSRHMYGFPFTQPFPDLPNTGCLIIVGSNLVISQFSFLQAPDPIKQINDIRERGGRVIVIDPRKTETARVAGEHIFIRPGTDVYFYLSFLNEVIHQNGIKNDHVNQHMTGLDQVLDYAAGWTAEKTASVTGIPADQLKQLVSTYLHASGASLFCSTGVNMGGEGALSFWIQEVINAVTGNLDRKGGTLVGRGIMDFPKFGVKKGLLIKDVKSRIGNYGTVNDAFPGGILADEILNPGKKQIKALFVSGGNPLITMSDSEKLKSAFNKLDLLVCLDIQLNETCSEADYVLPCTDPFQRPDLPFVFPLMLGLQIKPYLQATDAVVAPQGEQRDEASIYVELAKASGFPLWGSKAGQKFFESLLRFNKLENGQRALPQRSMLNLLLKLCRQPGFKKLLKNPHGILTKDHEEHDFLGKRVYTADKKVNLAPEAFLNTGDNLMQLFAKELQRKNSFKLIIKRSVRTHNSWTHNTDRMLRGTGNTNYAYLHPEDAARLKLKEGGLADVSTEYGKIRIPVKFSDALMPGSVAIPHGWGHQHAKGLHVANKTKGVNVNILAGSGNGTIDPLSGMSRLTAIEIKIEAANGPMANTWSGLPEEER